MRVKESCICTHTHTHKDGMKKRTNTHMHTQTHSLKQTHRQIYHNVKTSWLEFYICFFLFHPLILNDIFEVDMTLALWELIQNTTWKPGCFSSPLTGRSHDQPLIIRLLSNDGGRHTCNASHPTSSSVIAGIHHPVGAGDPTSNLFSYRKDSLPSGVDKVPQNKTKQMNTLEIRCVHNSPN